MDNSTDRYSAEEIRTNRNEAIRQNIRNVIRLLAEKISIAEADQTRAGIYIRRRGA